ncbi:MAG: EAL domain-containing protein [bacterium]|nr:EAL domain-containing protein [bacterium]
MQQLSITLIKRYARSLVVSLLIAVIYLLGGLEFLERHLMDLRFRWAERESTGDVVVVSIDPESLKRLEVFPWDRGYYATALDNLLEAGAQRVAFDIDFSVRGPHPDQDDELEESLAKAGHRAVLPMFLQTQSHDEGAELSANIPLARFRRHSMVGSINVHPAADGLIRRYWMAETIEGHEVPSLAALLATQHGSSDDAFYVDYGINHRSIPCLSFVDVLIGQFDPTQVEGKIVIVGATAVELSDQLAVPVSSSIPGPLLQGLAFESLRQGRALERAGPVLTVPLLFLITLLVAPVMDATSWRKGLLLMLAVGAGAFLASLAMQVLTTQMLDVSPWLLASFGAYAAAIWRKMDQQGLTLLLQGVRLQQTESLMSHVVESSFDAIMILDEAGSIQMFNPAAEKMFGYPAAEAIGRRIGELISAPAHSGEDAETIWRKEGQHEVVGKRSDGETTLLEIAVGAVVDQKNQLRVGVVRDISERRAQQDALQHQASHDPLTNLPNRILLRERFDKSVREARENGWSVALLLLDLDGFRDINDTLGHHVGDQLLQLIGRRLQNPLDPSHTIARFGSDEFAVLMPRTGLREAMRMAEQLDQALNEPFLLRKLTLHVSTSIGIALFPEHGLDTIELIQRADVAMYQAKRKRAGIAIYDAEQDYNSVRHLSLNAELREAIAKDQLTLFYQPKISIDSGRILSVEALVRWQHPKHGMLPPDEFIGLAEHSGLIIPLTHWVLGKAIGQYLAWKAMNLDIAMAVNLSARHLQERDLPQDLKVLLESCNMPCDRLILEITESTLMDDPERSLEVLNRLSDLGVKISIDDFGTGYSSLSYLKKLPADELKIDRSFVMALDSQADDAVIVKSTIEMAHNLGLKVVAEGIETTAIWDSLRQFDCDYGQGYLFGRPCPGEELTPKLDVAFTTPDQETVNS